MNGTHGARQCRPCAYGQDIKKSSLEEHSVTPERSGSPENVPNPPGTAGTYRRISAPSGSFLIWSLRTFRAQCPVVSPRTATMSKRKEMGTNGRYDLGIRPGLSLLHDKPKTYLLVTRMHVKHLANPVAHCKGSTYVPIVIITVINLTG